MKKFEYEGYVYTKVTKEEALEAQKDRTKKLFIVGDNISPFLEAYVKMGHFVYDNLESEIDGYEGIMDRIWSQNFDEIYFYVGEKILKGEYIYE